MNKSRKGTMARLMEPAGEKVCSVVPRMRPLAAA